MAYCTQADLVKALTSDTLRELTDDDVSGEIDSDNVTQAITFADSIVNGYLRPNYSVPVADPPSILKEISVSIASYKLYERRANVYNGPIEWIQMKYDNAMDMLKDIRKGNMNLDVEPQPAASSHQVATASSSPAQYFTDSTLENW